MTETCTSRQNEIIRYIYDETSSSENVIIEEFIARDGNNLEFYLSVLEIKEDLTKIKLSPKETTINNILNYSKNFRPTIYS